ncbi:hypothetical protein [Tsukamurella sp. USMM236]|uniref:hypothetical protein n=1 Tax=Tsukamurella sp. USMM236 TaxID=3081301 RepID=UPI0030196789
MYPQQPPQQPQQPPNYPPFQPPQPPKKKSNVPIILALTIPFALCVIGVPLALIEGGKSAGPARTTIAAATTTTMDPVKAAEVSAAAASLAAIERAARMDESRYTVVDSRTWKVIARDPDSYKGKWYRIYGVVTQADAATGASAIRMSTDGEVQDASYDYDVNTIVQAPTSDDSGLSDCVKDDELKMFVEVKGSKTYETTLGGSQTVPLVTVYKVVRLV